MAAVTASVTIFLTPPRYPLSGRGRHAELVISELNAWPASSPVNASHGTLPPTTHVSGPVWLAGPSPYGSCIRYSMPVSRRFPDPGPAQRARG